VYERLRELPLAIRDAEHAAGAGVGGAAQRRLLALRARAREEERAAARVYSKMLGGLTLEPTAGGGEEPTAGGGEDSAGGGDRAVAGGGGEGEGARAPRVRTARHRPGARGGATRAAGAASGATAAGEAAAGPADAAAGLGAELRAQREALLQVCCARRPDCVGAGAHGGRCAQGGYIPEPDLSA